MSLSKFQNTREISDIFHFAAIHFLRNDIQPWGTRKMVPIKGRASSLLEIILYIR